MTIYTVYFRSDCEFAVEEFEAGTPEQALTLARKFYEDDATRLQFEPYSGMTVNEIEVCHADSEGLASWQDDELRLRLAAIDLLDALRDLVARDASEAAECGFTLDEMTWLDDARRAIAKATGKREGGQP